MQFETFSEFLEMGGYGGFVLSVYAISAIVLIGNVVAPLRHKRKLTEGGNKSAS